MTSTPASPSRSFDTRGWITPAIEAFLVWITLPSGWLVGHRRSAQGPPRGGIRVTASQAKRVDTVIAIYVVVEILCYWIAWKYQRFGGLCVPAVLFCVCRSVDIVAVAIRITLFDSARAAKPAVASHARIVILGLINYIELIICFATMYASSPQLLASKSGPDDWFQCIYFSAMTQFTVGYGDITPTGTLRPVACFQTLAGLLLLSVLVFRFLSLLRPVGSVSDIGYGRPRRENQGRVARLRTSAGNKAFGVMRLRISARGSSR